nr:topology modulation protein [uncultured Cohaesibacter sp.]
MQRITIIGSSGSGKSTLARVLGERLDLPVIPIDQIFWKPGWTEPDKAAFLVKMNNIIANEKWIIEGNYTDSANLKGRLARSDLLIFLDPPRLACMWGILTRILKTYDQVRIDMAPGCPERFDWHFIKYVWNFPKHQRPKLCRAYDSYQGNKIQLHSRRQTRAFMQSLFAAIQKNPE